MANFKCKQTDCGHEFTGSDYTDQCEKCGSFNIESSSSDGPVGKLLNWFKENKIVGYGLVIIFLGLLLVSTCESDTEAKKVFPNKYSLKVKVIENHFLLEALIWTTSDGKRYSNSDKILPKAKMKQLFYFEDKTGERYLIRNENEIYPCNNEDYLIIMKPISSETIVREVGKKQIAKIENPKTKLDCGPEFTNLIIENARKTNNCEVKVTTNMDEMDGAKIMISISGKDGEFKNKRILNAKGLTKFNVWAYKVINGKEYEKKEFHKNGQKLTPKGCPIDNANLNGIMAKILGIAKEYGRNPSNRKIHRQLMSHLNSYETIVFLDDKKLDNGQEGMENMFIQLYEDEGQAFVAVSVKIFVDIDETICELHFKSK